MSRDFKSPEGWFRTRQKDLYALNRAKNLGRPARDRAFDVHDESDYFSIRDALFEWFAVNLPAVTIAYTTHSEYSGIALGPDYIVAGLDEKSLSIFNDAWKNTDAGWMVAERLSYEQWLARIQSSRLVPAPMERLTWWCKFISAIKIVAYPNQQQPVCWWDTPKGFVLISAANDNKLPSSGDAWWLTQRLLLDMKDVNVDDYPHGTFTPKTIGQSNFIGIDWVDEEITSWNGEAYEKDEKRINKLREALGI